MHGNLASSSAVRRRVDDTRDDEKSHGRSLELQNLLDALGCNTPKAILFGCIC
jgi:hypothetical protein